MCGIAGILKNNDIIRPQELLAMRDSFIWRGPDDADIWINKEFSIGFGHRRLSILDISSAGRQPMHGNRNGITIIFNGEIYNYVELREQLQTIGYYFKTGTDTEVIIYAYEEWGCECLKHFNGMFAFAIWDDKAKKLFIARDRIGIKPLYYYIDSTGSIFFASEIKAILAALKQVPGNSHSLIDTYMSFGYIPGENTLIKGIKHLLPGHYILIGGDKKVDITKYWELSFEPLQNKSIEQFIDEGRNLINSSIDYRLRSDVPLGIFLSGGIDSSTIVGLLAERVSTQLKTFSVAYDFGRKYNETQYARVIAEKFNTDHHEIIVNPDDFKNFIPDFIRFIDEPITESAAISLYFVSKLAREHVTVVLSGEGSDELFAGYDFYIYMLLLEKYRKIFGKKNAFRIAEFSPEFLKKFKKIFKYISLASLPLEERYKGISTYDETIKMNLYRNDFNMAENCQSYNEINKFLQSLFHHTSKNDALSQMLYFDLKTWLVNDLLIKADRMSMATSIELRVPFLDHRVVEFAARLPSKYKIKNWNTKYFLKQMVKDILPEQIINRKKMGFPTPLEIMFKTDLKEYAYDILLSRSAMIHNYFNRTAIETILNDHSCGIHDHHKIIWQLIVLEQWFQVIYLRKG